MRIDRLNILWYHLKYGDLGHEKFDFGQYSNGINKCGTAGCALGECPTIWDEWEWGIASVFLKGGELQDGGKYGTHGAQKWFELDYDEAQHLFMPISQITGRYGGKVLRAGATRYQVSDNIKAFIETMIEEGKDV